MVNIREEIIFAGFGGQGVLFAGELLAQTATRKGLNVTFVPSYGAEMRGGTSNCSVVISNREINCPLVDEPTSLVAFDPRAWDDFQSRLRPGGLAIVNSSLIDPDKLQGARDSFRLYTVPANRLAEEAGSVKSLNLVLLGSLLALSPVLQLEDVEATISVLLGPDKVELLTGNMRSLAAGARAVSK